MSKLNKLGKLLKYGNAKLKRQLVFTLPANKEICGRECPGCYAIKAQVRFPTNTVNYRHRMLEASKKSTFAARIASEINSSTREVVAIRVHESGDFYSQEYIDSWVKIAKFVPNKKFYAFTKRKKDFDFSKLEALPNFVLIDSLKFGGINYGTYEEMSNLAEKHGAKLCPVTLGHNVNCGIECKHCWTKQAQNNGVLFVKH